MKNNILIYYKMKYLFIDIRKSDEVYTKHFDQSQEYSFYNIPMNMIRFNAQTIIDHLEYVDEIFSVKFSSCLICLIILPSFSFIIFFYANFSARK